MNITNSLLKTGNKKANKNVQKQQFMHTATDRKPQKS